MRRQHLLLAGLLAFLVLLGFFVRGGPDRGPAPDLPHEQTPREERVLPDSGPGSLSGFVTRGGEGVEARVQVALVLAMESRETFSERRLNDAIFDDLSARSAAERTVETHDAGRFEADDLPLGLYRLAAVTQNGDRGRAAAMIDDHHPAAEVEIRIPAGDGAIHGVAVYRDGRPFRGRVSAFSGAGLQALLVGDDLVETGPDGRFSLPLPAGETARLTALLPGRMRVFGPEIQLPPLGEIRFVVDAGCERFEGRVLASDDDSPIEGAVLVLTGRDSGTEILHRVNSGEGGRFALHGPAGSSLTVTADGFAKKHLRKLEDTIRLDRLGALSGRVLERGTGAPVAGVVVHVLATDGVHQRVSGADGRFEFRELAPGEVKVRARGGGFVPADTEPIVLELRPGEAVTRDLEVLRGATAKGRVLDTTGRPVAGAIVKTGDALPIALRTRTGSDGRFDLDSLVPGLQYTFEVEAAGRAVERAGPFLALPGEPIEFTLTLSPPRSLTVRVEDAGSGEPVPDARIDVRVRTDDYRSATVRGRFRTGANGTVRVAPLPAGDLTVRADHPDYAMVSERVPVPADATEVDLELWRGFPISGRVVFPDGEPAGRARIEVSNQATGARRTAAVGKDGEFEVKRLVRGDYWATAAIEKEGTRWRAHEPVSTDQGKVLLSLERIVPDRAAAGGLVVRVIGPDGSPVPRASAMFWTIREDGRGASSGTVEDGVVRYRFTDTEPGRKWIEVYGAEDEAGDPLPYGAVIHGPLEFSEGDVEIRLPEERAISGTVRDATGRGLGGAEVRVMPIYDRMVSDRTAARWAHSTARSDEDGAFRVGGLREGVYLVELRPPAGFLAPEPFEADAGATGLALLLRPGVEAVVTVLDPDGKPVGGARVTAFVPPYPRMGRGSQPKTDARGLARFTGLDPDAYHELRVHPPAVRPGLLPSRIESWRPSDTTVRLGRAVTVRGRVVDPSGDPLPGALVIWGPAGEPGRAVVRADEDGRFEIPSVPPGEIAVGAALDHEGIREAMESSTTVRAGEEEIVLTVDPGLALTIVVTNPPVAVFTRVSVLVAGEDRIRRDVVHRGDPYRLTGLAAADRVAVHVERDGLVWFGEGLAPGEIEIDLAKGGTVKGLVTMPAGAIDPFVSVVGPAPEGGGDPLFAIPGRIGKDGEFEVQGVPEGVFTVKVQARLGERTLTGSARASPGDFVTLALE